MEELVKMKDVKMKEVKIEEQVKMEIENIKIKYTLCIPNPVLFIHKFQPIFFKDFEIDEETVEILRTLISMNNLNILFIGDVGSGKTSLLNALIR